MTEPQEIPLDSEPETLAEASNEQDNRIADLEKQLGEVKDRLLREIADAENTRRRAQKERDDTAKYAVAKFAQEILTVSDNFSRALEAKPKDATDPVLKNLIDGIEATERQMQGVMERFGIKKLDPVGQPFDPNFHRVMVEVDAPGLAAGTVVQVLQPGYVIHDRLLREALVAVAKGSGASPRVDTQA